MGKKTSPRRPIARSMHRMAAFACAVILICLGVVPGRADKRVALVIGNDRYANLPADQQLRKAVNDARAVGDALASLGFEVIRGDNLGRQAMVDKFDELTQRLSPGDTAFFFFSGHGVAIGGANYILPADVPNVTLGQDMRLARAALGESDMVADLQGRGVRVAVVVLDACRNNPFKQPGAKGVGAERGLGRIEPVQGVFTLYSAGIGQTALDRLSDADDNPNSVFTRVFVPALTKPGLGLGDLALEVREEVARLAASAQHNQRPAYYDETIGGRVYLAGLPREEAKPEPSKPPAGPNEAERAWGMVQNTTSSAVLEEFIRRFGDSFYAALARARLDELKKSQVAVVAPPVVPAVPAGPCGGIVGLASVSSRSVQPLSANEECALKPKDVFKECDKCPEMVVIAAGSFTMGSPVSDAAARNDAGPPHSVTIRKPFAVGRGSVTVDEFAAFVADSRYDAGSACLTNDSGTQEKQGRSWRNPGYTQNGASVAKCLSWNDAKAYAAWLSRKTGKTYRLLSEAESEYAKEVVSDIIWVEDCYHDSYAKAPSDGSAWISRDCSDRVIKSNLCCGPTSRFDQPPDYRSFLVGFRVARTL